MRRFFFIFSMLLHGLIIYAQYHVKGIVIDSIGNPIDAAVVVLMDAQDGNTIQQSIASEQGEYDLLASGKVQIYISCIGYKQYLSKPFVIDKDINLGNIKLQTEATVLNDVIVVGEKQTPSLKIEGGRMIYTPKNSSLLVGTTALDVLKKTPGVFVDGENNISIGGKNGVLVILNGKQTYMQKEELVSLLKSTPSASVSTIEVIHNPSAKYDVEGSGGVINITMEKKKVEGFFFSINNGVSYWDHLRENTEISFSYAQNRLTLTGNYNHAFGYNDMNYGMHRIQNGKYYYSPTQDTDKRKTISGNIGLEYNLSETQVIGGRLEVNTLFGPGCTNTMTEIKDAATNRLEQVLYAQNDYYKQKANRYGGSFYYTSTPREGVNYSVDFNYAWFDGGSGNWQPNQYVSPDGNILQDKLYKSVNSRNIHIYALSYNQQHPLWKGDLKSGLKFSSVNADNDYQFYRILGKEENIDETQSNKFKYKEQVLAFYLLYSHSIGKKLGVEVGLRGEYTFSNGHLMTINGSNNENNSRNYFNLFPTANLNYQISEHQSLAFGYSSRIDRPAYQDLNPFEYLLDELSYWKGNPFLTPQKAHRISLTYSYKRTALTASYSYMKDYKAQITDTLSANKVIMTPRNLGKQRRMSLTFHQGMNIARWWEINLNFIGYYVQNNISFDQYRSFDNHGFAGIFTMQNSIHLPWRIQMEFNGSYITKRPGASNEQIKSSGYVDIGFSRSFAEKKWTVNLAISDIFWTSRWDNDCSYPGFQLWNWGKSESRQVKLNVTYCFGKQKSTRENSFNEIDRL